MSAALTTSERHAVQAALALLRGGAEHAWAARLLLEGHAGPEGERPAWHIKHERLAKARAELEALLAVEPADA